MRALLKTLSILLFSFPSHAWCEQSALDVSVQELRDSLGTWSVTTEFLNKEGSIANTTEGSYEFNWVVPDRVLQGKSSIPDLDINAAILFYVRESDAVIEMVSVGKDGKLWIMTGPVGGDTRYTEPFPTQSGGEGQLRFTRYNVTDEGFESRMEWTEDGGNTWVQGNHQVFRRL